MRFMMQAATANHGAWPVGASHNAAGWSALPALQWACKPWQMPFDLMREQHAQAIRAGMIEKSILGSREFERKVDALEKLCLGPFARKV